MSAIGAQFVFFDIQNHFYKYFTKLSIVLQNLNQRLNE